MSANALLLWMSARRQGSWQQFRAAVEELHVGGNGDSVEEDDNGPDQFALPLYRALRFNFQRLGHAEFFAGAGESEWRVTPPCLAVCQTSAGWLGILVGARSRRLLQRLDAVTGLATHEVVEYPAHPDQIIFTATDLAALQDVARGASVSVQMNAPAALLASLPSVDDPSLRHPRQIPFGVGWRIDRFSATSLGWRTASLDDVCTVRRGLFRFSLGHQRYTLFCTHGVAYSIPGQVGKYLVLSRRKRRQVLSYDAQRCSLSVPASCRPPFLIERALVLCSGRPPDYEGGARGGLLRYTDISHGVASFAAALLRQECR